VVRRQAMSLKPETQVIRGEAGEKLGEAEFQNGKPHGLTRLWYSSGALHIEGQMVNGEYHGTYKSWWSNSKLKEEGTFHHGKRVGIYRWYSDSGELNQEHDYGPAF